MTRTANPQSVLTNDQKTWLRDRACWMTRVMLSFYADMGLQPTPNLPYEWSFKRQIGIILATALFQDDSGPNLQKFEAAYMYVARNLGFWWRDGCSVDTGV
jgi:hypothetical protein